MDKIILFMVYIVWNLTAFVFVMVDKRHARQGKRRIRERTFFLFALFYGAAGVLLGMYTFRHKTRHKSFVIGVPLLFILNIALSIYLFYY